MESSSPGAFPEEEIRAESDFYEPLAPYGRWEVVGAYGRCWFPGRVDAGWRPYSDGYWARTEAGWYWVTTEPWGWATYHYGRWDFDARSGWFWWPQTQWAPAWVSWYDSGGYIGWAPLHPSARSSRVSAPQAYVFVEQRHFLEPVRRARPLANNTTLIRNAVINQGPAVTVIEKETQRKVQAVPLRELRHREAAAPAAKPRTPAAASEKQASPPVRSETQPGAKKTTALREPPRVVPPAPQIQPATNVNHQPVPSVNQAKPAVRPPGNHPAAPQAPAGQKAVQHLETQPQPTKDVAPPARERPAAREKRELNPSENTREK